MGRGRRLLVHSFEIKYCLKGLGEGLVQTGTNWISPCSVSQSEEARSLGKVGRRKEGRGEREKGMWALCPLWESLLCVWGRDKCFLLCVCVCMCVQFEWNSSVCVCVCVSFGFMSVPRERGFWFFLSL